MYFLPKALIGKSRSLLKLSSEYLTKYGNNGPAFLAHTKQKVSYIVGLTALRLAFFTAYE